MEAVTGSSDTVPPTDLDSVLDIVGAVAPALLNSSSDSAGAKRRLLVADLGASATAEALAALSRSFAVVAAAQSALLAPMVRCCLALASCGEHPVSSSRLQLVPGSQLLIASLQLSS